MARGFDNPEVARRAGQRSGKTKKTKQWEALGDFITDAGAKRAMDILSKLPEKEFIDQYTKLLSYFKPKLSSTQLQAEQSININLIDNEEGAYDDI